MVGSIVGSFDGLRVGSFVGSTVGLSEGALDGLSVPREKSFETLPLVTMTISSVKLSVGSSDGVSVGVSLGISDGLSVETSTGLSGSSATSSSIEEIPSLSGTSSEICPLMLTSIVDESSSGFGSLSGFGSSFLIGSESMLTSTGGIVLSLWSPLLPSVLMSSILETILSL